jgi:predicted N-acyltransferase
LNIRFDHGELAAQLQSVGLSPERTTTHVLSLNKSHNELFAAYRRNTRQEVRRCTRKYGVQIRQVVNDEDVTKYCSIHEKLAQQKEGFLVKYPFSLISELVKLREHVILLVAEVEGRIVAGTLFIRDGDSMLAWHSAADRDYARLDVSPALMDRGIQMALELGLTMFNLGASITDSLRFFKTSFGAVPRDCWHFRIRQDRSLYRRGMDRLKRTLAPKE